MSAAAERLALLRREAGLQSPQVRPIALLIAPAGNLGRPSPWTAAAAAAAPSAGAAACAACPCRQKPTRR